MVQGLWGLKNRELATPYKIDITHWESIEHGGLKAHIEAVGILL